MFFASKTMNFVLKTRMFAFKNDDFGATIGSRRTCEECPDDGEEHEHEDQMHTVGAQELPQAALAREQLQRGLGIRLIYMPRD